ncbi:MAG: tetratricopeptide repeat protein [Deltaproteobacteria bacterium]|nr:tetratricopeptide repeat protein [Deltaproteobacteria bacterium]
MVASPWWFLAWRALVALCASVAPWHAPLDAGLPRSTDGALGLAAASWALLALLVAGVARALERSRARDPGALLAAASVLSALAASVWASRDGNPVGMAVPFVAPFVWGMAFAVVLRRFPGARTPILAGGAVLLLGTVALAAPKLRSRASVWEAVLARDPGNDRAYLFLAAHGDPSGLLERCVSQAREPSRCRLQRARGLVDQDPSRALTEAEALATLRPDDPAVKVLRAGALARQHPLPSGALAAAREAVALAPSDPHAWVALALTEESLGHAPEALTAARRAVALGAGSAARMLQARLAARTGDLSQVRAATTAAPSRDEAGALHGLGLLAERQGRYNDAREAFLRALAASPGGREPRMHLARLTASAGARDEALHHLEVLLREHPGDPEALALRRELEATLPAPPAALHRP